MRNIIEQRISSLQTEYEAGQKMLAELDGRRQQLTQTLLRIEGAMVVLRELLDQPAPSGPGSPGLSEPPSEPRS